MNFVGGTTAKHGQVGHVMAAVTDGGPAYRLGRPPPIVVCKVGFTGEEVNTVLVKECKTIRCQTTSSRATRRFRKRCDAAGVKPQ